MSMQVSGAVRYQLENDDQYLVLHAYLPEGLSIKDVDINFDSETAVENGVAIHIDCSGSDKDLATIQVHNCKLVPGMQAKYTSSKRRLTMRLLNMEAQKPSGSMQSANSFEFLESDDVEDSVPAAQTSAAARKKKKKKKKSSAADADGAVPQGGEQQDLQMDGGDRADQADLHPVSSGSLSPEAADSSASHDAGSKKNKKKKKKGAAGVDVQEENDEPAVSTPPEMLEPAKPVNQDEEQPQQQPQQQQQQQQHGLDLIKQDSVKFDSDTYLEHFEPQAVARTYIGAELPHRRQQGPAVKASLAKSEHKGEDKMLQVPSCKWEHPDAPSATTFSAWGIFDGHGGKQAATFTSKNLLAQVAAHLDRCKGSAPDAQHLEGEEAQDWAAWAAQEALLDRLPRAMYAGFLATDEECRRRFAKSGTTATLAIQCGWELLVANVGDSCAYLDTGAEVLPVSGNHRLDDSPEERERIKKAGGEIAQATADGVPVGPLRVWPGGLAMSRTIGDPEGGAAVTAEPEVRQVTLPATGARLVIASDGLWDHMSAKTLLHQIRQMPAGAASNSAMYTALKKKGLRDDITVLVIDFLPTADDRAPPALAAGYPASLVDHLNVLRPLQGGCSATWRNHLAQRRATVLARCHQEQEAAVQAQEAAEAARAAQAAAAAAEAQAAEQGMSDTYRELAGLRVDTADLLCSLGAAAGASVPAEDGADWVTVEKKHPGPSFMSELLASASVERLPAGSTGPVPMQRQVKDKERRQRHEGQQPPRHERRPRQQQVRQQQEGLAAGVLQQQEQHPGNAKEQPGYQRPRRALRPGNERLPRADRPLRDAANEDLEGSDAAAGAAAGGDSSRQRRLRGTQRQHRQGALDGDLGAGTPGTAATAEQQQGTAVPPRILEVTRLVLQGPAAHAGAAGAGAVGAGGRGQQRRGPRQQPGFDGGRSGIERPHKEGVRPPAGRPEQPAAAGPTDAAPHAPGSSYRQGRGGGRGSRGRGVGRGEGGTSSRREGGRGPRASGAAPASSTAGP